MTRWCAIEMLTLLSATGCAESFSVAPPIIVGERTVTVSADDPFIDMEDGTRLAVDGVPTGQSMQFKLTQYRDSNGKISVDVDTVPEPNIPSQQGTPSPATRTRCCAKPHAS